MVRTDEDLLRRPLYVFDLPEQLLFSLQLRLQRTHADVVSSPSPEELTCFRDSKETQSQNESSVAATNCSLCGLAFANLQDQRSHARSDLHNYNLKQKLRGQRTVTENEFEQLVTTLEDSLSGSDTSSSNSEDESSGQNRGKDSTLSALLKKQAKLNDGDNLDLPDSTRQRASGRPPLVWFSSPLLPTSTYLGVYRAIFSTKEQTDEPSMVQNIRRKQLAPQVPGRAPQPKPGDEEGGVPLPASVSTSDQTVVGPHYFLCMIGGGHFAAMVVSLTPRLSKKHGVEDRSAIVIAHKTFHRYTTRRKQGGSQGANDNAKGNAHSAGAQIRRHNEIALTEDVRSLLSSWKAWIDSAELLFVRASGTTNRRTLFGPYEGQVLNTKDDRLRGYPFSTRRATQSELMRAFVELTRIKVDVVDEALLAKQAEEAALKSSTSEASTNGKPKAVKSAKPTKKEEEATLHTSQLQALIKRSKAPALLSYIQSNGLGPDFRFFPPGDHHQAPTPLHLASASSSPICISSLLLKAGSDPTVRNAAGKTAFDIAGDRPTRDAFRLARHQLGEARWQWEEAHVPAALSQAEIDARVAREILDLAAEAEVEKKRRADATERLRRQDAEKLAAAHDAKFGRGHVLEKPKLTAEERRAEDAKGMSDELRLRMEREKRARAAEERMKRLQANR